MNFQYSLSIKRGFESSAIGIPLGESLLFRWLKRIQKSLSLRETFFIYKFFFLFGGVRSGIVTCFYFPLAVLTLSCYAWHR